MKEVLEKLNAMDGAELAEVAALEVLGWSTGSAGYWTYWITDRGITVKRYFNPATDHNAAQEVVAAVVTPWKEPTHYLNFLTLDVGLEHGVVALATPREKTTAALLTAIAERVGK